MKGAHLTTVLVEAGGWRQSGAVVRKDEPLSIVASGELVVGEDCSVRVGGRCGDVKGGPDKHLVGRVGDGPEFPVGSCWFGRAPSDGELFLDAREARSGSLEVHVSHGVRTGEGK